MRVIGLIRAKGREQRAGSCTSADGSHVDVSRDPARCPPYIVGVRKLY
jgi:hypothetical protein